MIKSLLKGTLFKMLDFIRPLIIIPFFVRSYGIESFGIYNQVIYLSTLMYPILDLGIGMGLQRFADTIKSLKERVNIFSIQKYFILFVVIIYVISVSFDSVSNLLFGKFSTFLFAFFTIIYVIIFSINNTLQGVLRADSKMGVLVKSRVIFAIVEAILLVSVLYIHKSFDFVYVALMVLGQFFYFFLLNRETKGLVMNFNWNVDFSDETKMFFKYSILLIPSALISWVTSSSDRFFITNYFGAESTGYYSIVAQYTGYMKLIVFPFTFVFFKDYCTLFDTNYRGFLKFYSKTFAICVAASIVFCFLFWISIRPIYEYYIGVKLTSDLIELTFWFLATFLLVNISSFMSTYLLVSKQTKVILVAVILGALLNFLLNKFLLKEHTYVYAIYYYIISVALQLLVMGVYIIKDLIKNEKNIIR